MNCNQSELCKQMSDFLKVPSVLSKQNKKFYKFDQNYANERVFYKSLNWWQI